MQRNRARNRTLFEAFREDAGNHRSEVRRADLGSQSRTMMDRFRTPLHFSKILALTFEPTVIGNPG
jgi:hypothetical protein